MDDKLTKVRRLRDKILGPPKRYDGVELVGPEEMALLAELETVVIDDVYSIDITKGAGWLHASREAKAAAVVEHLRLERLVTSMPREVKRGNVFYLV